MTFPIYGIKFIFQTTICWRWCWSMERNYIWIFTDSRIVLVRGFEGYIQCTSKVMQRYCRLAIFWRMKVNSMYSRQNIVDSWCPSLFLISDQTVTQIFGVAGTTVHETPLLIFPWLKSDWNGLFFPEIPQTSIHRRCPIPIFAASYHVFFGVIRALQCCWIQTRAEIRVTSLRDRGESAGCLFHRWMQLSVTNLVKISCLMPEIPVIFMVINGVIIP